MGLWFLAWVFSTPIFAEELMSKIIMKNGDTITGEIKQQMEGKITVKTQFGEITLNAADVGKIEKISQPSQNVQHAVRAREIRAKNIYDGFYLGGGLIYSDLRGEGVDSLNPGAGWDVRVGYSFGWVALEANVFRSTHTMASSETDWNMQGTVLNLKAYYIAPTTRVRGYFLVGYGDYKLENTSISAKYQGSGIHGGPGLEIFFNKNLALNFDIVSRDIEFDQFAYATSSAGKRSKNGRTFSSQLGLNVYF